MFALCTLFTTALSAQTATLRGTVTDPSGAVIPRATVELLEQNTVVASATTDAQGEYRLTAPSLQNAVLRVSAQGFAAISRNVPEETRGHETAVDVHLDLQSLAQQITVTATGTPTPEGQLGSAVTVLGQQDYQGTRDIQEGLRLVPGLQVSQTGQAGGTTALSIRGGGSDANKVLIDGIPVNDIGGGVQFADIASAGIASVEILRGPNSVLYGPDALAGVVSMSTSRGNTPLPLFTYLGEGGNFGTYHQEGSLGGAFHHYDYFSDYSRFDSTNTLPNDTYHNGTFAGNFGWAPTRTTSLRATMRHDRVASGQPNAIELYGIPDDTKQSNEDAYFGVTFENQTSEAWHNLVRYGGIRLRSLFTDFAPTGIPQYVDYTAPSGPVYNCDPASDSNCSLAGYLGAPVTIHGANGYTVSGQALFQYVEAYPNYYATSTDKDFVYAQSDYRFNPHTIGLFAFQYENERGYSVSPDPSDSVQRGNYNYTLQLQGDIKGRLFYTLGGGLQNNGLFGFAGTPRASLAYAFGPARDGHLFSGTKLRASFGEGIKEPSISDQTSSLFALLSGIENGDQLISQYHVSHIGPERSRTYDIGIDQQFLAGRAEASLTLFHNEFTDGIEYIPQQGLLDLGVPEPVVAAASFGATVNSEAYRAQGAELELEYQAGRSWFLRGGYTYLDTRVQQSFTSDAIGPGSNPDFPSVPIGIDGPIVGARAFRQAPHTGYFGIAYRHSRFTGNLRGTLVSRRDDSDFLSSDANGLETMLLPNRNLDGAYQRLDAFFSYQAVRSVAFYGGVQNLLSEHYSEVFGYPSLPFTFRSGLKFSFGGERWSLR
ncbi:TonB-dependent receptor [Paracidobacterium acidisoli]|uniref:TonB-dependent receptor n=1 Tax=Paracidobacterium acidisoli TaxID=2303751 RepID=UPI001314BA96|nr:TonB-dependent receptor [Paracidobacterium acidisoli]MBT9331257.1 TonB-dependent receptor [Paracidobacterium acidisoli]